jgi:hypothetical protein
MCTGVLLTSGLRRTRTAASRLLRGQAPRRSATPFGVKNMRTLKVSAVLCLFFISCSLSQEAVPSNWKKVNERYFEFQVPPDMEKVQVQGKDSYVGQYRNGSIELNFDYGRYSDPLNQLPKRFHLSEATVTIHGHKAKIVSYMESKSKYIMAVHFPRVGRPNRGGSTLTMYSFCKAVNDYDAVKEIFNSIRFLE